VGIVVATPTFVLVPGIVWQQWMCAAVVGVVKPLKVALTCSVWAVVSSITVANPVPREGVPSFAPLRTATKVSVAAFATGTGSISAAAIKNSVDKRDRMGHSTKWHPPNGRMTNL
jgi:hypothetical protein